MKDPVIEGTYQNDPHFLAFAETIHDLLLYNPDFLRQANQLMSNTNFQSMLRSPEVNRYLDQLDQQQQQSTDSTIPPNPWLGNSLPSNTTATATTTNNTTPATTTMPTNTTGNSNRLSDEELTEEEMIAEAIRRSLQFENNDNTGP
jgi:hypothetical protein